MKIININPNFNSKFYSNAKINKRSYINTNQTDSVSFNGKLLSYQDELQLKIKSSEIVKNAISHKKDALEVKTEAYSVLNDAQSEFINAMKLANFYKKNPSRTQAILKNGNKIDFQLLLKNENLSLEIAEFNGDELSQENTIREISAQNFIPWQIQVHNDDSFDIYQFQGTNVNVMKGIKLEEDFVCEKVYSFSGGKLISASFDVNPFSEPKTTGKMYNFFNDDLILYYEDSELDSSGTAICNERFSWVDSKLKHYYETLEGKVNNGLLSWDVSYHYNGGKLVAKVENGYQENPDADIVSKKAVVLNGDNKYEYNNNFHCRVSDFGEIIY